MTDRREQVTTRDLGNGHHMAVIRQYSGPKLIRQVISDTADTPGLAISLARSALNARLRSLGDQS